MAARQGNPEAYPRARPPLQRKAVTLVLLLARDGAGRVWLAPQASAGSILRGIWQGLYTLPIFADHAALLSMLPAAARERVHWHAPIRHTLTHRDLVLHVAQLDGLNACDRIAPTLPMDGRWFAPHEWSALGLPAPIARLLDQSCRC
jgi:A/G-specific adenine glycosylase